jgi:pimeloyl-ACP methyl ester carboxylesterase
MKSIQKIAVDAKVTLAYQIIGDTNTKPLLVFLHEGLGSIAQWKNFPELVCAELNLPGLVYERYGYGLSTELLENRESDYLEHEANYFLPLLLKKLQFQNKPIILIGHSDGASIALIYASLFPKNILKVVSIAAHVFNEQISIDSIKKIKKEYELNTKFKRSLEKYHPKHADSTFYAFANTITSKDFKHWNIENYLADIQTPVLVIQGKNDEYGTEKQVNSIYSKCPNANNKRLIITDCGHSPHLTHKKIVIEALKNFIEPIRL